MSAAGEAALDVLVVGAGPTGIAVGAEARRAGLSTLLVDKGALTQNLLDFPTFMTFFTTRELLEIAAIPFAIPDEKPDRRQALAYYRAVAGHYQLPLALHEEVLAARRDGEHFRVGTRRRDGGHAERVARAVVLATGYFGQPKRLGVAGESGPAVRHRYGDAYPHFGEHVAVVGGGNSAAEASLDLWRGGARVTLVHRGAGLKETVKYWLKPDLENRIAAGAIAARFAARVTGFANGVEIERQGIRERLAADACYVLIGYLPDAGLQERCGVRVDPQTLVPDFDPETCESNVPGLYIAGTLQAGRDTGRIFIENSRDHGTKIVQHLRSTLG